MQGKMRHARNSDAEFIFVQVSEHSDIGKFIVSGKPIIIAIYRPRRRQLVAMEICHLDMSLKKSTLKVYKLDCWRYSSRVKNSCKFHLFVVNNGVSYVTPNPS